MGKVVIDMSMSLDGFITGPGDGPRFPLGERGARRLFDWYFSGTEPFEGTVFRPDPVNRPVLAEIFANVGAMLTGRLTFDITNGWGGSHPVNAIPVVVLTHNPPSAFPQGKSEFVFVSDGIRSGVARAKALAGDKRVAIGGASVAQQALQAGLVDEIYLHIAPIVLGVGKRLFEQVGSRSIQLNHLDTLDTNDAQHVRYEVVRNES
jgi:dihydrofolate reductase